MGDNHIVDIVGGKIKHGIVPLIPALLQAAVNENLLPPHLYTVAAAGDALVGAAAVGAVFDTVNRSEAAFCQAQNHAHGVFFRLPFQGVATCRATDAFYKTCLI